MRNVVRFRPIFLLAVLATAGCAINQLRVEYGREVATQGKAAAVASRGFLDQVEVSRENLEIELIAADPVCSQAGQSIIRARPIIGARMPASGSLCNATVQPGDRPWRRDRLDEELKPSLALIEALASYAGALGEIVNDEEPDPAKAINDALATALAFQGAVRAVAGGEGPLPAADDGRVTAITGFIGFLSDLQHEADRVRRLRQVVVDHPEGASGIIAILRRNLGTWDRRRREDLLLIARINDSLLDATIRRQPPLTASVRREALRANYAMRAANAASYQLFPALVQLLTTLDQADKDFRRILVEDPELNDRDNRQLAELTRQRIVQALGHFTALITAFRGA